MAIKRPLEAPFIAIAQTKTPKVITDEERRARQRRYSQKYREKNKGVAGIQQPRRQQQQQEEQQQAPTTRTPLGEVSGNFQAPVDKRSYETSGQFSRIEKWLDESTGSSSQGYSDEVDLDAEEGRVANEMTYDDEDERATPNEETTLDEQTTPDEETTSDDDEDETGEFFLEGWTLEDARRVYGDKYVVQLCEAEAQSESSDDDTTTVADDMSDASDATARQGRHRIYNNERYKIYDEEDRITFFRAMHRMGRARIPVSLSVWASSEEDEEDAWFAAERLLRKYPERIADLTMSRMVEVLSSYGYLRGMAFRV